MPVVVLLIVLAVIVFLLAKSLQDAKRQQEAGGGATPPARARQVRAAPSRPARQRPRRRQPVLDEEALAAHVAKLREAVATELISVEDAVDSIVRQTDGAVGPEAALKLLQAEDDAA